MREEGGRGLTEEGGGNRGRGSREGKGVERGGEEKGERKDDILRHAPKHQTGLDCATNQNSRPVHNGTP